MLNFIRNSFLSSGYQQKALIWHDARKECYIGIFLEENLRELSDAENTYSLIHDY